MIAKLKMPSTEAVLEYLKRLLHQLQPLIGNGLEWIVWHLKYGVFILEMPSRHQIRQAKVVESFVFENQPQSVQISLELLRSLFRLANFIG